VVVFNPADLETALTSEADETGAWSIDNVPPPPFAVLASHGYSGGRWVVVREPTPELNLVLRPLITIRGQLVEPDGRPVEEQFIRQVFPFEWEGRIVTVDHPHRWDCGTIEKTDDEGRFLVRLAPDDSGVVHLNFDYCTEPACVDGSGDVRLVISDKTAESRAMSRKYAHLIPKEKPEPPTAETRASCALPTASKPDLSPADFESRNRTWIGLLQSEPPAERVALLEKLREEISGGG